MLSFGKPTSELQDLKETRSPKEFDITGKVTAIFARYSTNAAVVDEKTLYIWGDNLVGKRFQKPKLWQKFQSPIV